MMTSKQSNTRANERRAKEANRKATEKGKREREEEIGKERANKMARVKWGRGKREANANNVMREIGIAMGTWYG